MVQRMMPPIALAERLALLLALTLFLGLAFEENLQTRRAGDRRRHRTFPIVGLAGGLLYLVEPQRGVAFAAGPLVIAAWPYAFLCRAELSETGRTLVIPASNVQRHRPVKGVRSYRHCSAAPIRRAQPPSCSPKGS